MHKLKMKFKLVKFLLRQKTVKIIYGLQKLENNSVSNEFFRLRYLKILITIYHENNNYTYSYKLEQCIYNIL